MLRFQTAAHCEFQCCYGTESFSALAEKWFGTNIFFIIFLLSFLSKSIKIMYLWVFGCIKMFAFKNCFLSC